MRAEIRALGERAQQMIDALARVSADPDRLTRFYLTEEHKRAAHLVGEWMRGAGMAVRMDAAGTMHGLLAGSRGQSRKRLLVGSHIDTVIDAGRYDGNLGVVAGIIAADEIRSRGVALPFDLEVLAFGDEEGVRFPITLLGSSVIAGLVDPNGLDVADAAGVTLGEALRAFGGDPAGLIAEAYRHDDVIGYLEVHIEQGPVLEEAGEPLGVVSAIASQGRYRLLARGEAGHAGTVPMPLRHDALAAAAEVILLAEEIARREADSSVVATVGEIAVVPGASNVIPGEARFSLDLRASSDQGRKAAADAVREYVSDVGARRGVTIEMQTVHEKPVVACAARLKQAIATGIEDVTGSRPRELMSGAGHDGQAIIHLTDIGMMFVRCRAGVSHNPEEFVTIDDMGLAAEALTRTIVELGRK